jgi:Flp pilus assembly protein TadG
MKTRSMISGKLRRFIRHDKGAAMAELAILVPFLILLVAAISEFGRFFQTYTALSKSTRAAARYLSNHPFSTSQTQATNLAVCGQLSCAGVPPLAENLSAANVCIESTQATGSTRIETVTVSISGSCSTAYNFKPLFDIGSLLNTNFMFRPAVRPSTTMYYMLDSN